MDKDEITEQRIRELGYAQGEELGKPDGSANRFWEYAEECNIIASSEQLFH